MFEDKEEGCPGWRSIRECNGVKISMHIIYLHETIIKTILLYNYCLLIKTGEGQRAGLASRHLSRHLISASCTGSYH